MKAVQTETTGSIEALRLTDLPEPQAGPGEVLIRVEAAAVNFMDLMRVKGLPFDVPTPLPFVPGAEVSGTVVALGEGVESLEVGARVFGASGQLLNGGWAELTTARAAGLAPIPAGMAAEQAAGLTVAGAGAAIALIEAARTAPGETVFVPAAGGGFGGYAVQIAKALGATVIAGAGTPQKRQVALDLGADHAVDYRTPGWTEAITELTGGTGADVVLEGLGPQHVGESLSILAPFGRVVVYGVLPGYGKIVDVDALAALVNDPSQAKSVTGFNVTHWLTHRPQASLTAVGRLLGWIADGTVTGPRITSLPLAEAAHALTLLERGENTGKTVLIP
ncbi:quinone oxidoreductase family protein [Actinoplanes friuliensis]|uniref:NADPH quinone oxidoreductase n=1 Tax=Actinoplanes friuliensis DSM 7358 TaxID=1246995 RepID=U5VYD4_9ACTN|nr:zinc-binding dehydrogenase [Actinoplanes friuliensis]AGZ40651.1 NADPH quinone oxidoreductase [Actinoplanes friuliensis DSM 7358]